jgi:hypothetical protein
MKTIHIYLRNNRDSFIKAMIILTGIALPSAILCYLFPAVQLYFFLLWRILFIMGLIIVPVLLLISQILGNRSKKSRPILPVQKAPVDFYRAIADFPDDEFEKFCNRISDPAIRAAVKYDRELLRS